MRFYRQCGKCNSQITYTNKNSWYNANARNSSCLKCSKKAGGIARKSGSQIKCRGCEIIFYQTKRENRKFCSRICRDTAAKKPLLEFHCQFCKSSFYRRKKDNRKNRPLKFCSVKCLCLSNIASGKNQCKRKHTAPENKIFNILREWDLSFQTQFPIPYKSSVKIFDFYIPSHNMLLEVDGIYWHAKGIRKRDMNTTQLLNHNNDKIKNRLAKEHGFKLVRIWEDEISTENLKMLLNV